MFLPARCLTKKQRLQTDSSRLWKPLADEILCFVMSKIKVGTDVKRLSGV
jgi:hypothetical protein